MSSWFAKCRQDCSPFSKIAELCGWGWMISTQKDSSSHTDLKQQKNVWGYNRCAMLKSPLHVGRCQGNKWKNRSAQHGPLVVRETGKSTYRPCLKSSRPGAHKAVKQKEAIFNYPLLYRNHTFLSTPRVSSHVQLSPSWSISIDKKATTYQSYTAQQNLHAVNSCETVTTIV